MSGKAPAAHNCRKKMAQNHSIEVVCAENPRLKIKWLYCGIRKVEDLNMESCSRESYQMLRKGAEILSIDANGEKVLRLLDGTVIKLFRIKKLLSSAHFFPYCLRFAKNAEKLREMGIPTVKVLNRFRIPGIERTAVQYVELKGESFPRHAGCHGITDDLAQNLGSFLADLHGKGIYFRSIHLENILVLPDGSFGLIDVSDMKIYRGGLCIRMRVRNFAHFARYPVHRKLLRPLIPQFLDGYFKKCRFSRSQFCRIENSVLRLFEPEGSRILHKEVA